MGHGIFRTDRFGEVRQNGRKAWHGLGEEIPEGIDVAAAFEQLGLDWETELLPVYADRVGPDGVQRILCDEHRLHVRSDTGQVLGLVTDHYVPIQNREIAAFADGLAGLDAAVVTETAGSLQNCRRVFALVRMPGTIEPAPGDEVLPYILVSSGHGGYASFAAYPTTVRVVCANTLRVSERDASKGLSFRHMGEVAQKMDLARRCLGAAQDEMGKFAKAAAALVRTNLTGALLRTYFEVVWEKSFGRIEALKDDREAYAKATQRMRDDIAEWTAGMENPAQQIASIRGTAWAALNAITEWSDHSRGRLESGGDARTASNLFGASHKTKTLALRAAVKTFAGAGA